MLDGPRSRRRRCSATRRFRVDSSAVSRCRMVRKRYRCVSHPASAPAHACPDSCLLALPRARRSFLPPPQARIPGGVPSVEYEGMQKLHYEIGPFKIKPGQNEIAFRGVDLKPQVPGYITRFEPNIERARRHGPAASTSSTCTTRVWLARSYPMFASGEEKTIYQFPRGLRLPPRPGGRLGHDGHDPQPPAQRRRDLDHVGHRLRAAGRARRAGRSRSSSRRGWTSPG